MKLQNYRLKFIVYETGCLSAFLCSRIIEGKIFGNIPLVALKTHNSIMRESVFTHKPSAVKADRCPFAITKPGKKKGNT